MVEISVNRAGDILTSYTDDERPTRDIHPILVEGWSTSVAPHVLDPDDGKPVAVLTVEAGGEQFPFVILGVEHLISDLIRLAGARHG